MNDITIFNFKGSDIRTMVIENEPWFVGKDVADTLGYKNTRDAIAKHVFPEDKTASPVSTQGQIRNMVVINESGLYGMIFGSELPTAKEFKRWVTSEVLPAIRKTGSYRIHPDSYMIEDPIERARAWIEEQQEKKQLEIKNSQLTVSNEIMRPKADYFDDLVDRNMLSSIRDTGKELRVKERVFVKFLLDHGYLYRDKKGKLTPKAGKGDGLFQVVESKNDKTKWAGLQTMITPKGRETFRLLTEGLRNE